MLVYAFFIFIINFQNGTKTSILFAILNECFNLKRHKTVNDGTQKLLLLSKFGQTK